MSDPLAAGDCWLVTGGAGYIGAHVVRALHGRGLDAVVLDDLSTGSAERVEAPLVTGSVLEEALVADVLREHRVRGVLHIAGRKQVGESMAEPLYYYRENVDGLRSLLAAMHAVGVEEMVFTSSAAVYGLPDGGTIDESGPCRPVNPYGETKLVGEWLLADAARAYGLRYAALRYFNVAGAAAPELGDPGCTNLVPLALRAMTAGERPQVYGADYDTPDGTCLRDYVHVADIADAHLAVLPLLAEDGAAATFNVGCGRGYSVREVLAELAAASGIALDPVVGPRRAGDPARVVADVGLIRERLGWQAKHDLTDIARSAWAAWQLRS